MNDERSHPVHVICHGELGRLGTHSCCNDFTSYLTCNVSIYAGSCPLLLLYRPAYLLKVKEAGAERLTNFNKSFRKSKIFIKIMRMSQRISVMTMIIIITGKCVRSQNVANS